MNSRKPPKIYSEKKHPPRAPEDQGLILVDRSRGRQSLASQPDKKIREADAKSFSFREFPAPVQKILQEDGIEQPTRVQSLCFGPAKDGRDLLVGSETGTGKTLAFCLPLAGYLNRDRGRRSREATPVVLILCPSRELAQQVARVFTRYLRPFRKKTAVLVGGESYQRQSSFIRFGVDCVVGTPGRVADFLRKGDLSLSCVDQLILDEVDQMLESGFEKELHFIHERLRRKVQTLFFSATISKKTAKLAKAILTDPVRIDAGPERVADRILHRLIAVKGKARLRELHHAIGRHQPEKALVFCETRAGCESLAEKLMEAGHRVALIHGELEQEKRQIALSLFKKNQVRFLIATNVASRGIDITDLPLVINYTLPRSVRDYTHRTGRTARAGKKGEVWNLVQENEQGWFREICNRVGISLNALKYDEPVSSD